MQTSGSSQYTFTPVTGDLVRLSAELEQLSGSARDMVGQSLRSQDLQGGRGGQQEGYSDVNALVGVSLVACRICGRMEKEEETGKDEEVQAIRGRSGDGVRLGLAASPSSAQPTGEDTLDVVAIRDPRAPRTATPEDAIRRYKVHRALPPWTSQERVYLEQGKAVTDWVWRGFSATLVSFGQQGTGKSYTLYNDAVSLSSGAARSGSSSKPEAASTVDESCGLLVRILHDLFGRIARAEKEREAPGCYKVGLSCWEILGNKTVDLLKPFHSYGDSSSASHSARDSAKAVLDERDCVTVSISSLSESRAALSHARSSSTNWYVDPATRSLRPLPNRSHAFVRVVVFDSIKRTLASLHVVDLVGSQSTSTLGGKSKSKLARDVPAAHVPRDLLSEHERERKGVNQQLLAFSRLVGEVAQQSDDRTEFTGLQQDLGGLDSGMTKRLVHLSARETKLTRELAPLLAGESRCFLMCAVSRSNADYIDTANTLRVASRFARIFNACSKRVLSVNVSPQSSPNQLGFTALDDILSLQEQANPFGRVPPPHTQPGSGRERGGEDVDPLKFDSLEGMELQVPKISKSALKGLRDTEGSKKRNTAEVIHLTLSQVENIEQVANKIMETTKEVDKAIEESLDHSRVDEGEEKEEAANFEGEGSYYSSLFPEREVTTYQDPILSGAVKFIHSSSSSSSGGDRTNTGFGNNEDNEEEATSGTTYAYSHSNRSGLNDAARSVAMQRLKELGVGGTEALPLHSPVTSDDTDLEHESRLSNAGLASQNISRKDHSVLSSSSRSESVSPSISPGAASSVKSVETQRKLDVLKQNFQSMYNELELPSVALSFHADPLDESSNANEPRRPVKLDKEERDSAVSVPETTLSNAETSMNTTSNAWNKREREDVEEIEVDKSAALEARSAELRGENSRGEDASRLFGGQSQDRNFGFDQGGELGPDHSAGGVEASPSRRDYEELERSYDSLLKMLERERSAYTDSQSKVKLLERDLLESQHTVSAELDGHKLENITLRSRCRQLEELIQVSGQDIPFQGLDSEADLGQYDSFGGHGNVKDKNGGGGGLLREIFEQLENEVDRLNDENKLLHEDLKTAHLMHAETVTLLHKKVDTLDESSPSPSDSETDDDSEEEAAAGKERQNAVPDNAGDSSAREETRDILRAYRREQRELLSRHQKNKLSLLAKRLRKLEEDLQEARNDLASYRKKDRKYAIQKRGVEETIKRVGQLQRQLEHKSQELVRSQLKFAESEGKCYTLSQEHAKMQKSVQSMSEKIEHSESVKRKYAEQLQWARKQVSRDVVLSKLPQLPSGSNEMDSHRVNTLSTRKIQSTAGEICRRIRREPGISPRVENMLDRLMQEIGLHVQERVVLARREALLLQMITGDNIPGMRRR